MRTVKGGMGQDLFRPALVFSLGLCLAGLLAGCSGNAAVYPYPEEQRSDRDTVLPYLTMPRPTATPSPTLTPVPVLTRDEAWMIPDPYGYQDETGTQYKDYYFRDLCGDYPMPDTVEVELTAEQQQALDDFFAARPELVERIGTHNYARPRWDRVLLMDLTGDGAPEILIPYITQDKGDSRPTGGVIEVYELSSGRCLGKLYAILYLRYTKDEPLACMGWYRGANGETAFYVLGFQNFVKGDPTALSGGVHHFSHILWRVGYDGHTLQSTPLWFYDVASWPAGFVGTDYHISIVAPDPEEMVAFSLDPYTQYNHIFDMAQQGADPVIARTLRQLEPVRTEYAVYEYEFPPPVRPERGTAAATAPKYWGQQGAWYPQSTFPLGLQLMDYFSFPWRSGPLSDAAAKQPPDALANQLADPLPEEPPKPEDSSPFCQWGYQWMQAWEADGSLSYYRIQEILFGPPNHIRGIAYLLWQAVPEGEGWRLCPVWLYVMQPESDIMAKNGVDLHDFTVLRPSAEDAAAFALDPTGQYDAMLRRGTAGADPIIYEDVARLRPIGAEEG